MRLFYLGWEFHFRGFLQFGLGGRLGPVNAILIQVMASSLLHIGKPPIETFAAIGGGVLWGVIAYRTQSLPSGHATFSTGNRARLLHLLRLRKCPVRWNRGLWFPQPVGEAPFGL